MSNSEPFLFHFININSFSKKKKLQVKAVLNDRKPIVLGLAETHLAPDCQRSLKIPGYIPYNFTHTRKSSGLLVYVRNDLCSSSYEKLCKNYNGSMCAFLDVCSSTDTIRVGFVYIRPSASTADVELLMKSITTGSQNRTTILLGDFNMRSKEWGDTVNSGPTHLLQKLCLENNLVVLNKTDAFGLYP